MATKVKLRRKPMEGGRESLYLDFYPPVVNSLTGKKVRREYLKLYVWAKAKTTIERKHNSDTVFLAEQLRFKRENRLLKDDIYSDMEKEHLRYLAKANTSLLVYYESVFKSRCLANCYRHNGALLLLKDYCGRDVMFLDVDLEFCEGFRKYMLRARSLCQSGRELLQNTKHDYFRSFRSVLLQAFKEGYLREDFSHKVDGISRVESNRQYLTIEELNRLIDTSCAVDVVKRASIFSALTGLRFGDVQSLSWREVEFIEGHGWFLNFRQGKTGGLERLPISDQAAMLMGARGKLEDVVFVGFNRFPHMRKIFRQWVADAGIVKHISFHCFRHSFATNQLMLGTAITTVSKLLGHRDLKTTMVYAKVVDSAKREAVDKLVLKF